MTSRARPGRPSQLDTQDAAARIVQAACLQYAQHGIKGSSKRQIAEQAQVTPALVHYYFREPDALPLAVLQQAFTPLLDVLGALPDTAALEHWVHGFHSHLVARPWLPHLMIREVLPLNGALRGLFLRDFAPRVFGSVRAMVAKELARLQAPPQLDLDRHVVLLLGMLVYPLLGLELAQDVTGRTFDKAMLDGFRDDALRLFRKGLAGAQET